MGHLHDTNGEPPDEVVEQVLAPGVGRKPPEERDEAEERVEQGPRGAAGLALAEEGRAAEETRSVRPPEHVLVVEFVLKKIDFDNFLKFENKLF